jgi:hypothetical protein
MRVAREAKSADTLRVCAYTKQKQKKKKKKKKKEQIPFFLPQLALPR